MKNLYFLLTFLITAVQPVIAQTAWRIEPGKYIGNTKLGVSGEELGKQLGHPDGGDAAMGKAWSIWYSHKADNSLDSSRYLAVYLSIGAVGSGNEGMHVKQVRINTASFKTKAGIKVGSSYASVKKAFPHISRAAVYEDTMRHKRLELYDDVKGGIAFEIAGKVCTAVTVHESGESMNTYIQFPGYEGYIKR
ncbi:hypothetical protein GO495_02355 [Chitinophaga oryziterrae]|uniref:Uncharacterized protein n=1 Tax=Chitinophaga oryziterrae TaxID=1031224 RepID=A0A6N8J566_9BACT|nr:hypothetical protein [Chitinophaga oryziterrae]MVT39416.1 hypothetical protein [Chitinophaga oryziterrae]